MQGPEGNERNKLNFHVISTAKFVLLKCKERYGSR